MFGALDPGSVDEQPLVLRQRAAASPTEPTHEATRLAQLGPTGYRPLRVRDTLF